MSTIGLAPIVSPEQITVKYDLHTWDSYVYGQGLYDAFSINTTDQPCGQMGFGDPVYPVPLPGTLPFVWGGTTSTLGVER